eukprot:13876351-Ditylum_brightwellii.AAC.1
MLEQLDLSRQRDITGSMSATHEGIDGGLGGLLPSFSTMDNLVQLDLRYNKLQGPIPADFLQAVDSLIFEYAFLNANELTGTVTMDAIGDLPVDSVFLEDNKITDLEEDLCFEHRGGVVQAYGCSGILCPPGKYGPTIGRQESESSPCEECSSAQYWGTTSCFGGNGPEGIATPTKAPTLEPTAEVKISEREILLKLYDATGGPNWNKNDGWANGGSGSFCSWYGVGCLGEGDENGNDTVEYL